MYYLTRARALTFSDGCLAPCSILEALKRAASAQEDVKKVKEFADFLEKIFVLDPERRITVSECLKHPFLQ